MTDAQYVGMLRANQDGGVAEAYKGLRSNHLAYLIWLAGEYFKIFGVPENGLRSPPYTQEQIAEDIIEQFVMQTIGRQDIVYGSVRAYLRKMLKNTLSKYRSYNHYKREDITDTAMLEDIVDPRVNVEEEVITRQEAQEVRTAARYLYEERRLTELEYLAFWLRYIEDKDRHTIAKEFHSTADSISASASKAKAKVKGYMQNQKNSE